MRITGTVEHRLASEFDRFVLDPVPALFSGLAGSWPAVQTWNPTFLGRSFPRLMLTLHQNDPADGTFLDRTLHAGTRRISLAEYAAEVSTLDPRWSLREDGAILRKNPAFLEDLNSLKPLAVGDDLDSLRYLALWFSPAGQVTGLHADLSDIFLIQVYGQKSVYLSEPRYSDCFYPETTGKFDNAKSGAVNPEELIVLRDEVRWAAYDCFAPDSGTHPLAHDAEFTLAELRPGDVLFLPRGWWHAVRSETVSISVSLERAFAKDALAHAPR